LQEFLEARGQAYILRVAFSFPLTLAAGTTLKCAEAVKQLVCAVTAVLPKGRSDTQAPPSATPDQA
jgi:hypothetical protein